MVLVGLVLFLIYNYVLFLIENDIVIFVLNIYFFIKEIVVEMIVFIECIFFFVNIEICLLCILNKYFKKNKVIFFNYLVLIFIYLIVGKICFLGN